MPMTRRDARRAHVFGEAFAQPKRPAAVAIDARHDRVGGFVRQSLRIETTLGGADVEEKIVAESKAVRPARSLRLGEKYLPLLLALENVNVRFAGVLCRLRA